MLATLAAERSASGVKAEEDEEGAAAATAAAAPGAPAADTASRLAELARLQRELPPCLDQIAALRAPPRGGAAELGQQLAHRVLRDALALQLARRGFDGLRSSAMWLLTELCGDYIVALGTQLAQAAAPPPPSVPRAPSARHLVPYVVRLQRHTALRTAAEWQHLRRLFPRSVEPAATAALVAAAAKKQQRLGGPPPPPGVQGLYATLHTAWQHLLTPAGRQAHAAASASDAPLMPPTVPPAPSELALVIHLPRKPRQQAEHWVNSMSTQQAQAARGGIVVPGAPLDADAPRGKMQKVGDGAGGTVGGKGAPPPAAAPPAAPPLPPYPGAPAHLQSAAQ